MLTRARALIVALAAAAALGISACGAGGGSGLADDDPATLAPADAPFYLQATLRPEGKAKANVEGLASTVSGYDDPFERLVSYIDQDINDQPTLSGKHLSFEKDIDPWLGAKVGVFVEGFSGDPPAAGIVQTEDSSAARQFLDDTKKKTDTDRTYKGVHYTVQGDDYVATGLVGDFLVIGAEPAFKKVVDVSKGSDSLADQSAFTDALGDAPSGSVADGYLDLEKVGNAIQANDPASARGLRASLGDTSGKSALFSLVPNADSLQLDATTDVDQSFTGGDLASLIGSFPAESFASVGLPDLGGLINRTIDQLDQAGVPGVNRAAIEQRLSEAGISLDDVTSALGDLGVFVGGESRSSLQGAAVITTKDPSAAAKLISKITTITGLAQLSGSSGIQPAPIGTGISVSDPKELGPQPLIVTTKGDRIAIGYGKQATVQALKGGGAKLSDDPTYKEGVDALGGEGVSGYLSLPRVFGLADRLGARRDPDYRQARPYLQHLSYLIFGGEDQGDRSSSKIVVGVRG